MTEASNVSSRPKYDWRTARLIVEPREDGKWAWRVKTAPIIENGGLRATPFLASGEERSKKKAIAAAERAVQKHREFEDARDAEELPFSVISGRFV